jgi:hypothetical protein
VDRKFGGGCLIRAHGSWARLRIVFKAHGLLPKC